MPFLFFEIMREGMRIMKEKKSGEVCGFTSRIRIAVQVFTLFMAVILACTYIEIYGAGLVPAYASPAVVKPEEGDGTADHPYKIGTAQELYWFAELVNSEKDKAACAVLTKDIEVNTGDVSGCDGKKEEGWQEWTPIGDFSSGGYEGTFDGQGHTISGLYFNDNEKRAGLFARLIGAEKDAPARVRNVGIVNSYINGEDVGGIAGQAQYAEIDQCFNTSMITSDNKVTCCLGGIVGESFDTYIHNCFNTGTVIGKNAMFSSVAGICGYSMSSSGKLNNCYYQAEKIDRAYNTGNQPIVTKTEGVSAEAFAAGKVTYLLNANDEAASDVWVQNVDNGNTPYGKIPEFKNASKAAAVYQVTAYNCDKTAPLKGVDAYSNNAAEHVATHIYNSSTGICSGCGKNHKEIAGSHSYDINHKCTVCGYVCPHTYDAEAQDGICIECGYGHEHEVTDFNEEHVCGVCGYFCKDHKYNKGTCSTCGYEHPEHTYEKGACTVCGFEHQEHQFEEGVCIICGYNCPHKYADGFCTICGVACTDHHYVNGFCNVCKGCESATDTDNDGILEIDNSGKLYWFAEQVNAGSSGMKAELTRDIVVNPNILKEDGSLVDGANDLRKWTPIGTKEKNYTGEFDGNGHTISGLYCTFRSDYSGLFGYISNATIKNIGVKDSWFYGKYYTGSICAYSTNNSLIGKCFNDGSTVIGTYGYIGGISGYSSQTDIRNCYNTGDISATESLGCNVGGICGGFSHYDSGSVENCSNTGKVSFAKITGVPKYYIGGICGFTYNQDFKNCYYLDDEESDELEGTTHKTREQFSSGEVTWLLDTSDGTVNHTNGWKQNLETKEPGFDKQGLLIYRLSYQKEDDPKRYIEYFDDSYDLKPLNLSGDWVYEGDTLDQKNKDGDSYIDLTATIYSDLTIKQLVPIRIKSDLPTDIAGTYPREFSTIYLCDYVENLENVGGIKSCEVTEGTVPPGLKLSESREDVGKIMGFCDEAGTYPVTFTLTGKYDQKKELKLVFKIAKAEGELKFKNYYQNHTYDGGPLEEPTNDNAETFTNREGEFSRRWFSGYNDGKIEGLEELQSAPKDVGIYTVQITKGETKNRKAVSATMKIEIKQAYIHHFLEELEITPYKGVYDGKSHDAVKIAGVSDDMKVQYSLNDSAFSEEMPQLTDKGSYKIAIQISGDNFYNKYIYYDKDRNPWISAGITEKELTSEMVQEIPGQIYTGNPITLEDDLSIIDEDHKLILGKDYEITGYSENTFAGSAAWVEIQGKNNYTGIVTQPFTIVKADRAPNIPDEEITVDYEVESVSEVDLPEDWEWTEESFDKELHVGETTATAEYMGEDKGNYKVESVEIQITRQECPHEHTELVHKSKPTYTEDGYTGDIQCIICNEIIEYGEVIPRLDPTDISGANVYGIHDLVYTGKAQTLHLEVVIKGETLKREQDYTIDYEDNTKVGKATVRITGTNGYTGTIIKSFLITKAEKAPNMPAGFLNVSYSNETVSDILLPEDWEWKESDKRKELIAGETVTAAAEYVGTDKDCYESTNVMMRITRLACAHKNTEVTGKTEASYAAEGYSGDVYCKICGRIVEKGRSIERLKPRSIAGASVYGIRTLNYTGKPQTLPIKVIVSGKTLSRDIDYTLSYKNNTKIGTAEVWIKGKNMYSGSIIKKFKIAALKGRIYSVGSMKYQVTSSAGTVKLIGSSRSKTSLKTLTISSSVKIGGKNFRITAIGDKAFKGYKKLKKVTVGNNIVSIGKESFSGCKSLKYIYIKTAKLKTMGKNAIKSINKKSVIKVPRKQLKKYKKLMKSRTGFKKTMKIRK